MARAIATDSATTIATASHSSTRRTLPSDRGDAAAREVPEGHQQHGPDRARREIERGEARGRQPLRAPEEHGRDARAVHRAGEQDLPGPEARDEPLDGRADALVDARCGGGRRRCSARPRTRRRRREAAERARHADGERVHQARGARRRRRGSAPRSPSTAVPTKTASSPKRVTSSSTAPVRRYQRNAGVAPDAERATRALSDRAPRPAASRGPSAA